MKKSAVNLLDNEEKELLDLASYLEALKEHITIAVSTLALCLKVGRSEPDLIRDLNEARKVYLLGKAVYDKRIAQYSASRPLTLVN